MKIVKRKLTEDDVKKYMRENMGPTTHGGKLFFKSKWLDVVVAPDKDQMIPDKDQMIPAEGKTLPKLYNIVLQSDTYKTKSPRHRLTKAEKKRAKKMATAFKLEQQAKNAA